MRNSPPTLVYACSGCSSAAQLANHLAVRLDRLGVAEMSCISGIGGNVRSLVRKLDEAVQQGRPILAIDGCVLACVQQTLALKGVTPHVHLALWQCGVKKVQHQDFDADQAQTLLDHWRDEVSRWNAQATAQPERAVSM